MTADTDRSALVLYGSETGNAQDMAEDLGRLCSRLRFRTDVDELDAVDLVCSHTMWPHYVSLLGTDRMVELTPTVSTGLLRHLNHWPRRHASQLPPFLEKAPAEEIATRMSSFSQVHLLWPGR